MDHPKKQTSASRAEGPRNNESDSKLLKVNTGGSEENGGENCVEGVDIKYADAVGNSAACSGNEIIAGQSCTERSVTGTKKRSFRSIAENCMVLENGFLVCRIEKNSECVYKQKPQRLDSGNFIRHLRSEHTELARARGLFKDEDSSGCVAKKRRVAKVQVAIDHQTIVESVVRMTGVEDIPVHKLESKGFKLLLDPLADALGMTINSEQVIKHLSVCAEKIKDHIRGEVKGKLLSLKIDSASRHNRHILGINVQFWDGQEVVIRTLAMLELRERQTAKYIMQKIEEVVKDYDIAFDQIFTVTCDNGANMLAAVKELDKYVQSLKAENLMSGEGDEDVENDDEQLLSDLMIELSNVIKYTDSRIRSVTAAAKHCRKIAYQPSFDLKNVPLPPLYAITRWGGIYDLISNLCEHEEFYKELGKQFKELDLSDQWEFVHEYKNALEPIRIATDALQNKHVSLGDFYIHWLRCMMEVKKQPTNELAVALTESLQTRLQQLKQNLAFKASLLIDPRFNYISSSVLTPEEKEETRKFIIATSERIKSLNPDTPPQMSDAADQNTSTSNLDDFMTRLFGGTLPSSSQNDPVNTFEKQLNALDLETHQNYKYDTWKHWTARKDTHPELSAVALVVMTVPSTQVSVERSFSALAIVLSPARTKLSAQNLANILLIKLNSELLPKIIPSMYDWKDFKGLCALVDNIDNM